MKVIIKDEEELVSTTKELLHIMCNLRHWTKIWGEHYGHKNLTEKKKWEKRADDLLEKLNTQRKHSSSEYHITIQNEG